MRVEVLFHSFLPSALDEGEWLASVTGHCTGGKELRYPPNEGLLGSEPVWNFGEEKILLSLPVLCFSAL